MPVDSERTVSEVILTILVGIPLLLATFVGIFWLALLLLVFYGRFIKGERLLSPPGESLEFLEGEGPGPLFPTWRELTKRPSLLFATLLTLAIVVLFAPILGTIMYKQWRYRVRNRRRNTP